jgi:hypothetical protein
MTATVVHVVHEETCPDIGDICAERDEPPQLHDQNFYIGELRPTVEYALLDRLSLELQIPLRVNVTTVVYRRLSGEAFEPDYVNIHHRNETLAGIGDPPVAARTSWSVGPVRMSARAGVSVPLGHTEENPFALGREGRVHQHIQFGTGTFNPLAGVDASYSLSAVELFGYAQTRLTLYENSRGYRAGNRYGAGLLAQTRVVGDLHVSLGADVVTELPERWDGVVEQDGNLGRTDVLMGVSAVFPLGDYVLSAGVNVPVYQHIIHSGDHDGGQLSYPAILNFSVRRIFDL